MIGNIVLYLKKKSNV